MQHSAGSPVFSQCLCRVAGHSMRNAIPWASNLASSSLWFSLLTENLLNKQQLSKLNSTFSIWPRTIARNARDCGNTSHSSFVNVFLWSRDACKTYGSNQTCDQHKRSTTTTTQYTFALLLWLFAILSTSTVRCRPCAYSFGMVMNVCVLSSLAIQLLYYYYFLQIRVEQSVFVCVSIAAWDCYFCCFVFFSYLKLKSEVYLFRAFSIVDSEKVQCNLSDWKWCSEKAANRKKMFKNCKSEFGSSSTDH